MKTKLWLVFLCFFVLQSQAQFMDTIRDSFRGKKSLMIRYESRNSFVDHLRTEVTAIKVGVNFGRKISLGAGYSWLTSSVFDQILIADPERGFNSYVQSRLQLGYFCISAEYVFYKSRRWQYSIPMQFGVGSAKWKYQYLTNKYEYDKTVIALYEPGVNVRFKVFSWLGIGGNVGYRLMLKNNKKLSSKFNSPLYSFGILIYWDEVARFVFPKDSRIGKKLGKSDW